MPNCKQLPNMNFRPNWEEKPRMRSWTVQVAPSSTQGLAPLEGRVEVRNGNRTSYELARI